MDLTQIFQKKAIEKLKSPGRKDELFRVVPPLGWGVLLSVAIVLCSVLIWSFFGILADKVSGYGIITGAGGVVTISPTTGGRVKTLKFAEGAQIRKGDVVAELEQNEMRQNMYLQVEQSRESRSEATLAGKTAELSTVKERYLDTSRVISPCDGTITNIRVREGDIVPTGGVIYDVKMARRLQNLCAVVYVPALEGAKIKQGSTIHISPGAFDSKEYGSLVGRVFDISEYPVTSERISYWTGNKEFASWIATQTKGAFLEVTVELIKDPDTPSGYLWTSVKGGEGKITEGMTCTAQAIVRREAPVVKAFRRLASWIRSD